MSTPRNILARASVENFTSLAILFFPLYETDEHRTKITQMG
jgi:hypothetical protein